MKEAEEGKQVEREFNPEDVERFRAGIFGGSTMAVDASDYDKLLALYRAASTPEAAGPSDERIVAVIHKCVPADRQRYFVREVGPHSIDEPWSYVVALIEELSAPPSWEQGQPKENDFHVFVWRADWEDCSICGKPHHGHRLIPALSTQTTAPLGPSGEQDAAFSRALVCNYCGLSFALADVVNQQRHRTNCPPLPEVGGPQGGREELEREIADCDKALDKRARAEQNGVPTNWSELMEHRDKLASRLSALPDEKRKL